MTTALPACLPAWGQVLPTAPQHSKLLSANSLESKSTEVIVKTQKKAKHIYIATLHSTTPKIKGVRLTVCTSIYLFADVTGQNKQLGDVWFVSGGQFQEVPTSIFLVLSSGSNSKVLVT